MTTQIPQQALHTTYDADAQSDSLLARAQADQSEQVSLLDALSVDAKYSATLAAQIEGKHEQADRIEERLESRIDQEESRLQQTRSQQPGLIALPSTRSKWQQQLQQQQGTLQRLNGRLVVVREIKDGMGLHCPRIEEFAARKLRHTAPGLASEWEELQEALRMHAAVQRKKDQELGHQLARAAGLGMSNTLVLVQHRP